MFLLSSCNSRWQTKQLILVQQRMLQDLVETGAPNLLQAGHLHRARNSEAMAAERVGAVVLREALARIVRDGIPLQGTLMIRRPKMHEREKKLMRIKLYDSVRIPALPKSAAEARTFRNSVYNAVCKCTKGDEMPVVRWIEESSKPKPDLTSSAPYSILDRVLGSKMELSKNTKFNMLFQSEKEKEQRLGKQPRGRKLLWMIFERSKMDKDPGI